MFSCNYHHKFVLFIIANSRLSDSDLWSLPSHRYDFFHVCCFLRAIRFWFGVSMVFSAKADQNAFRFSQQWWSVSLLIVMVTRMHQRIGKNNSDVIAYTYW